jgi:hypothetical protein
MMSLVRNEVASPMALPTDENIDFLLCDAVRQNPNGKLDLAGYFPIAEVKLESTARLPAEIDLTFVFVLKDGDGQFRAIFRIVDPLGRELHHHEIAELKKSPDFLHVMMLPVTRIPITNSGNYEISLEIAGQRYRRSVRIFQ